MKKATGYIKLQIPAGKANPAPPVGPALGQHGSWAQEELGSGVCARYISPGTVS